MEKIGRNDPCHCGSGKKYKKCHLDADQSARAAEKPPAPILMQRGLAGIHDLLRGRQERTPLEEAQDLMYDAWEATRPEDALALVRQALELSPDCADAWSFLAGVASSSAEKRAYLEKAVAAGVRALGPEMFEENAGHFWGIFETRPYMRARHALAIALRESGDVSAAIEHFSDMLRLCEGDNLGVRYSLASCFLEADRGADLKQLLDRFPDEDSASWAYSRALLAFRDAGDTERSRKQRDIALASNRFVPSYLTGKKKLPGRLPEYIGIGDENEAVAYADENLRVWKASPGAIEWLVATPVPAAKTAAVKRRRNHD